MTMGTRSDGFAQTAFWLLSRPDNISAFDLPSYLQESIEQRQPLCGNAEGWGPLSPIRYDFTPCFLDVWISAVGLFGMVFGIAAILWLMRWNQPKPVGRNWHFYLKLVSLRLDQSTPSAH